MNYLCHDEIFSSHLSSTLSTLTRRKWSRNNIFYISRNFPFNHIAGVRCSFGHASLSVLYELVRTVEALEVIEGVGTEVQQEVLPAAVHVAVQRGQFSVAVRGRLRAAASLQHDRNVNELRRRLSRG